MENWDNLRFILALSRHRTMSAAAQALHTNVATVSRRIERANQDFGTPLFVKDQNGWLPTQAALPLIRVAEEFDAGLTSEHHNRLAAEGLGVDAQVMIAAPPFYNTMILVPKVHSLLAEHPRLRLEIRNRGDAMGLGEADIMLRVGRPESGRLVARRLASYKFRAYRSARATRRVPGWIALGHVTSTTALRALGIRIFGSEPRIVVSLFEQLLFLMRSTGLPAILSDQVAAHLPDIEPVETDEEPHTSELWMVYHATRRDDVAIRVVSDWIVACFREGELGPLSPPPELVKIEV